MYFGCDMGAGLQGGPTGGAGVVPDPRRGTYADPNGIILGGTRVVPVLKAGPGISCPGGFTLYPKPGQTVTCPPLPAAPGAPQAAPPTAPGAPNVPVVDYGNPSTYPGPNVPPPSAGTSSTINSMPSSGGGMAVDDGTTSPATVQAGMFGNVSPVALGALALAAFFLFRKRR